MPLPAACGRAPGFADLILLSLAAFLCLIAAGQGRADVAGLSLPSASQRVSGFDGFVFPDGIRCRQAIGAPGPYLDAGFAAEYGADQRPRRRLTGATDSSKLGVLGYLRFVIPFAKPPPRINCAKLFAIGLAYLQYRLEQPADWVDPRLDPQSHHVAPIGENYVLRDVRRRIRAQKLGSLAAMTRSDFTVGAGEPGTKRTATSPRAIHQGRARPLWSKVWRRSGPATPDPPRRPVSGE